MAEESELVGGISVSLGATHEHLAGDIAAANAIVEEQWSNKVFTAKLRVESASGAGQIGPAAAPGAAQAGPIAVQPRAVEEASAQTAQARSALAIPTQQTTPGMTEGERVVEGLGGVEDATSGVAKSVQELAELQGRGTEAPTPAVVSQQRVERVQAAAGEINPSTGTDVEAARTAALLSTHLENLNANIIGLGDRLGGAPARGGGRPAPGPAVSFGPGGSVRGGQLENLPTALQAQIRSALGETEQGAVKTTAQVVATARPQQAQATEQIGSNLAAIVNEIVGRLSALSAGLGAFTERLALVGAGPVGATPRSQAVAVERAAALRSAPVPAAREAIASVELQAQTVSVEPPTTPAARAAASSIGVPVTASSMQMRDAEQAAAVRARRETQNEARVAATAVQDRGIPDTSQEWLEERYTRPLAAQAAVEAVAPAPRPATAAGPGPAASAPHSYNVSARGAYNAPGYNYDISSAGAQGPVHVASSSETFRTQDEAVAAGNIYAQRMAEKVREDLGMVPRREETTQPVAPVPVAPPVTAPLVAAAPREPQPAVTPYAGIVGPERAAAAATRLRQREEVLATPNIAGELGSVDVLAGRAVGTVEIAAQRVSMPAAQVEAQAVSIEAPRAAVTTERPESVALAAPAGGGRGGRPPRRPTAVAAPPSGEEPGEEGGLTGMTRRAAFAMREEERAGAVATTPVQPTQLSLFEGQPGRRPASQTGRGEQLQMFPQARSTAEPGRGARLAAAAEADENENRLANSVRFAGRAMAEEERFGARVQGARSRAGRIAYNESEKQRRTELNTTVKHYDSLAVQAARYFDAEANRLGGMEPSGEKAESQQRLQQLSYEAQRVQTESTQAAGNRGFAGRTRTPAQIATFREEEARRANAAASAPRTTPRPGLTAPIALAPRPVDEVERARRRALAEINDRERVGRGGAGAGGGVTDFRRSDEEIERRQQLRVAQGESQRLTAARTSRTFAAGLGGFSPLGTARQQIEANAGLAASNEKVAVAQKRLNDPANIRSPRAYRQATEELTVALKERAKWTEKIEGLTSGGTALRTLAAVTVAGAAFGLAMQGVSVAVDLVGKAVGPTLERLSGFAATTAAYTDSLADATRQASGNAQAVTALKLASSGLSATTAASIQPFIQQRAEIEAGNKAIEEQIAAFHVSENLRKQGAGAGLGGGTGGFLGTGLLGVPGTGEQIGNLLRQQGDASRLSVSPSGQARSLESLRDTARARGIPEANLPTNEEDAAAFTRALSYVNEQLVKGGAAGLKFSQGNEQNAAEVERTAAAFDELSPAMAAAVRENQLYAAGLRDEADAKKALSALNYAATLPDPELLMQQFNRQNPALINAAERQQQFAANVQLPAQQALQNLATPLKPVGTGFAAANAEEQRRVADTQKESIQLQDQLNKRYEQGVEILENTYKVPPQLLNQIKSVGQQIAGIQASISNEQAAYQTAQYNYQLGIAKRTLSDIGGLTGKNFGAGQSYLGQLEKENLALSRQGQQLQFNLSQRSINFQRAVAGFTAPGLTPEERAARIEQANIEADIAQKQLNIGKNIFQNQVQIVDIQNLRQGADLVKQIALLEQGRAVTIDVQVKTEELERLILLQQEQVAEAGTYIAQVESLVQAAFGQIQQLEVAAGSAVAGIANKVLKQFGLTLDGINNELEEFAASMSPPSDARDSNRPREPERRPPGAGGHAEGVLGRTSGTTDITIGEAGAEEVAVLRNPRAYLGGGGGGQSVSVVFTGEITVRGEDDLRKMEQMVESAIVRALGRGSSLQGLRLS